jgi:hypothetical protein
MESLQEGKKKKAKEKRKEKKKVAKRKYLQTQIIRPEEAS